MKRAIGALALLLLGLVVGGCQNGISQDYVFPNDGTDYLPTGRRPQAVAAPAAADSLTAPASSTAPDADRGYPIHAGSAPLPAE